MAQAFWHHADGVIKPDRRRIRTGRRRAEATVVPAVQRGHCAGLYAGHSLSHDLSVGECHGDGIRHGIPVLLQDKRQR